MANILAGLKAGVQVTKATVFVTNNEGYNLWSATVQPGFATDPGQAAQRLTEAECEEVAQVIGAALNHAFKAP